MPAQSDIVYAMAKETPTKKKNKKTAAARSAKSKQLVSNEATPAAASVPASDADTAKPLVKTKGAASAKVKTPSTPASKLVRWYKWLGLALFAEGLVVVVLNKAVTAPVSMQYPAVDALASESNGHQVLALASRHLADVHIGWVVATFLIVFAAINLMLATGYRPYIENVVTKRGTNVFRWLALGLGGGLMITAIALLSGVASLALLLLYRLVIKREEAYLLSAFPAEYGAYRARVRRFI